MFQWNAALAMTFKIGETDAEQLYQEIGLGFSQNRLKVRRLYWFYKINKDHVPTYLYNLIPTNFESAYSLKATIEIPLFKLKYRFFKRPFLSFNDNWMQ